jgi:hypothetical protein
MADARLFVAFYCGAMPRFLQVNAWIDRGAIEKVRLTPCPANVDSAVRSNLGAKTY